MDYDEYRRCYFRSPPPAPRFALVGVSYVNFFVVEYERAVAFYSAVFGEPGYVEDAATRGWAIGRTWLTLFTATSGAPSNVSFAIEATTPAEAERLRAALITAGATAQREPSDQLMYEPMRYCPVRDPFGTEIIVYAPLSPRPACPTS